MPAGSLRDLLIENLVEQLCEKWLGIFIPETIKYITYDNYKMSKVKIISNICNLLMLMNYDELGYRCHDMLATCVQNVMV